MYLDLNIELQEVSNQVSKFHGMDADEVAALKEENIQLRKFLESQGLGKKFKGSAGNQDRY